MQYIAGGRKYEYNWCNDAYTGGGGGEMKITFFCLFFFVLEIANYRWGVQRYGFVEGYLRGEVEYVQHADILNGVIRATTGIPYNRIDWQNISFTNNRTLLG